MRNDTVSWLEDLYGANPDLAMGLSVDLEKGVLTDMGEYLYEPSRDVDSSGRERCEHCGMLLDRYGRCWACLRVKSAPIEQTSLLRQGETQERLW